MRREESEISLVGRFAGVMLKKLRKNAHKPGLEGDPVEELIERLDEEVAELKAAVARLDALTSPAARLNKAAAVVHEAADVANFAAFIADVCGLGDEDAFEISADKWNELGKVSAWEGFQKRLREEAGEAYKCGRDQVASHLRSQAERYGKEAAEMRAEYDKKWKGK